MSGGNKIKIFVRGTSVGGEKMENVNFSNFGISNGQVKWKFNFFGSLISYTPNRFIQLDFCFFICDFLKRYWQNTAQILMKYLEVLGFFKICLSKCSVVSVCSPY